MGLNGIVPAGVVTGDNLIKLFEYCKKNGHAIPGKIFKPTSILYLPPNFLSIQLYVNFHNQRCASSGSRYQLSSYHSGEYLLNM